MNKRILALAEQAGMVKILEEHAHEYGNGAFDNTLYPELEKFAELIAAECADVCQQFGNGGSGYALSAEIREHFGVEE
jgi:hypothetical protein